MDQVAITRFPALHCSQIPLRDPLHGNEVRYHIVRGNIDLPHRNQDETWRYFASFIFDLLCDDEIVFDFFICSAQSTSDIAVSGTMHAKKEPAQASSSHNSITLFETASGSRDSQSDFGIILQGIHDDDVYASKLLAARPFVVAMSNKSYSIRISLDLVPETFLQAISTSFLSHMRWSYNDEDDVKFLSDQKSQISSLASLSVLNHPPLMAPPDFEKQLGLPRRSHEYESTLLQNHFQARVEQNPEKCALDYIGPNGRVTYTYKALDHLSTILAERILEIIGTDADQDSRTITVFLSTSPELYIAWLGVLKAGCVVSPIPIECPSELLQHMTGLTSSKIVLGSTETLKNFEKSIGDLSSFALINVERIPGQNSEDLQSQRSLTVKGSQNDVAYILFTSGSTGKPKGVQITHHAAACAIAASITAAPSLFKSGPSKVRWFQMAAPTFDLSVLEIFVTLSIGGTICSCDRTMMLTDSESIINQLNANVLMTTPSIASLLRPKKIPTLREVWVCGEMLKREVAENFACDRNLSVADDATNIVNAYGPTEATICCTLDATVSVKNRVSLIGPPMATCSIIILDSSEKPKAVPMGFAGELAIGGPQLSVGYLKSSEQTAAAFVDIEPYGKLYRTGDKARVIIGSDGTLKVEFLGRLYSDQIKISGRRVELGEIEAGLRNPLVAEVAVVALKPHDPDQTQAQLVAVITPQESQDEREILENCLKRADNVLQSHMRPKLYYIMDKLPRLPSDKIDRKTLAQYCLSPEKSGLRPLNFEVTEDCAVETNTKPMLSSVINMISNVAIVKSDTVTSSTTLLSLGIDSLRSVTLLQNLREAGIEGLQITDILACHNLGDLNTISEKALSQSQPSLPTSNAVDSIIRDFEERHKGQCIRSLGYDEKSIISVLPVTTFQARTLASYLLTADADGTQTAAGSKAFIQHTVFYVKPDLSSERVIEAWVRVLSRYDIMRTVFVQVDDELTPFAQCILAPDHDAAQIRPHMYYTKRENESEQLIKSARKAADDAITLYDPPRRLSVIQTPNQTIIILSMLHSIFDGGSEHVIWEDVEREYVQQASIERTGVLTAVQRHFSEDRDQATKFWQTYLDGLSSPSFPCLRSTVPGSSEIDCGGCSYVSDLLLENLTHQAAALHASPLSILQAAWAQLLLTYTGERDVSFGNVVADRFENDLVNCSAPVLSIHPVRVTLDEKNRKRNIDVLLDRTTKNAAGLSHLHTLITSARYDTIFALQMYTNSGKGAALYEKVRHPAMPNDRAVMIEVYPCASGTLEFRATYQYALLDDVAARAILEDLARVTEEIMWNPERQFMCPPDTILQHRPGKFEQANGYHHLGKQLLHECVSDFAQKSPSSIALAFYDQLNSSHSKVELSYADLERKSELIASFLTCNLSTDSAKYVVPICMEKCPEMYITLLGILKAGAAWCPIDPNYPPARQILLIKKTNAGIVFACKTTAPRLSSTLPTSYMAIDVHDLLREDAQSMLQSQNLETLSRTTIQGSDIAYIIFTSGTTGTPKGVPISHEAASISVDSYIQRINFNFSGNDIRYIQFANYTFDAFVGDVFAVWKLGGTLVSATRDILLSSFIALANQADATHTCLTPTFASTLHPGRFNTLRVVAMGGETLPQSLANDWMNHVSLCNLYGPAETAINVTINNLTSTSRSRNIGKALPAVNAIVMVSEYPVMRHGLGELVISGPQLSPGYWDHADGNNDCFRWNDALQCRVYHTGDYVRQLVDGSFDFVGRKDDLVKIRGMRVELKEISNVCSAAHESISHTEVFLAELPGSTQPSLVCFIDCGQRECSKVGNSHILATEDARSKADLVKRHAFAELPRHMVPDIFIPLNALPRNQSSKINRKQLLEILAKGWSTQQLSLSDDEDAEPEWYNLHRPLLERIRDIIKILPTSLSSNTTLSEMGIDSVGAIRLSSSLKNDGHKISAMQVLDSITICDLISRLSVHAQEDTDWKTRLDTYLQHWKPLVADHLGKNPAQFSLIPTTVFQDGMLVETLRSPLLYWGSFSWQLSPTVNTERLRETWQAVSKSHDVLRLSFLPTVYFEQSGLAKHLRSSSMFVQLIDNEATINWQEIVGEHGDLTQSIQVVRDRFATSLHEKNLSSPPWQITILSQQGQRFMILTMHHSLYDGTMLHYLMKDVTHVYISGEVSAKRCQVQEAISRLVPRNVDSNADKFWVDVLGPFASQAQLDDTTSSGPAAVVKQIRHRNTEMKATYSASKLVALARELGATSLSPLFRVAFGAMLTEYSEMQNALFGEVRSERLLDSKLVDAIAPLLATYPVLFNSSGRIKELVQEQQRLVMESIKYGPPRPSEVRKALCKSRNEALYSAILVLHPRSLDEDCPPPWEEIKENIPAFFVDHEFALNIFENEDDTITISLSVDETMMSSSAQEIFLSQLDTLLVACGKATPEATLSDLNTYFPDNLLSMTTDSNVSLQYPSTVPPSYYIEKWARIHPDWKAVEVVTDFSAGQKLATEYWTYKRLNGTANQVANFIIDSSVRGQAVAVSLDRSLIAFAIILGIMKSGNTYVPVETSLPSDRKSFLLKNSKVAMAFFCDNSFDGIEQPADVLLLDVKDRSFLEILATKDTANVPDTLPLDFDAYLLYTSGSTGTPKGVRVSRQNLSSYADAWGQFIGDVCPKSLELGGVGKFLCLASTAFDVHIGEMFLAWRFGFSAVTGDRLSMLDDITRTLDELHITHAAIVPSLLDQTGLNPEDAPDLVYLGVGGEKMTPRTQKIWSSSDRVVLVNAYGPTEVTIGCSAARLLQDSDTRCIGHPLGDSIAHVLVPGASGHVKKGMAGELVFEGSLVANGYLNRPDAKGFCDINGRKMYRTGDIVRMDADNSILFLGRKDEQVKLRGQRLELGEVSEVVRSLSASEVDVVTLLLKHPGTSKQFLVSFVAPFGVSTGGELRLISENHKINNSLRLGCEQVLPAYMVPDAIISVSFIPLRDTSAKTDAKALEQIFHKQSLSELFSADAASTDEKSIKSSRPLTMTEEQIVSVFKSVVAQNQDRDVTPDNTLFQLGLDSIASVGLSFKLRELGYKFTVARLLQNPTIEQLGSLHENTKTTNDEVHAKSDTIKQKFEELEEQTRRLLKDRNIAHVESIRPCMPLQEVLVAHTMSHGIETENEYISHFTFELNSIVTMDHVEMAWAAVVRNNELLRTYFISRENDIVQVVIGEEYCSISWNYIIGTQNDYKDRLRSYKEEVAANIITNIDSLPPVRFTLASCDGINNTTESFLFMLSIHHALYDMVSIEMILQDFETAYKNGSLQRRPSTLPLLKYVAAQQYNESEVKSYWAELLRGYNHIAEKAPTKSVQTAARTFRKSLTDLERLCSQTDTTLSALTQGLFGCALSQKLQRGDFVFGVVLSGRSIDLEGVESMAAPCISTIPQRLRLGVDGKTVLELVKAAQDRLFRSMQYQHTSLRALSRWLGISGPLFSSLFSFTKSTTSSDTTSFRQTVLKHIEGEMFLDFELALECEANMGTDTVNLRARSTIFETAEELDALLSAMESLLTTFINGEDEIVGEEYVSLVQQTEDLEFPPEDDQGSSLEQQIRNVVVAFSGCLPAEVKRTTPFIKYGVDSITTIRFSKMLRQNGFQVSGADVLRNPSVAKLAMHIQTSISSFIKPSDTNKASENSTIESWSRDLLTGIVSDELLDDVIAVYPLTPLQAGMVSATIMIEPTLYSYHHSLKLPNGTETSKIMSAWGTLVAKHDILRTSFHEILQPRPQLVGAVHQNIILNWNEVVTEEVQEVIDDLVERTKFTEIASFRSPPVGATLIRGTEQLILVVSLHHATYDGTSIRFMFEDLWAIFHGLPVSDRKPFYDAAMMIHNASSESVSFWTESLEGYQGARPIADFNDIQSRVAVRVVQLMHDVSVLERWCVDNGVNISIVCQLAVGKAVCAQVKSRDVVLGQVHAARIGINGADEVVGPMLNTVPQRICLKDDSLTNSDYLRVLQASQNNSLDHLHASLSEIQQLWRKSHSLDGHLFEVLFVFRRGEDGGETASFEPFESESAETLPPSHYDLVVVAHLKSDASLELEVYSKFSEKTTDDLVDLLIESFESVLNQPHKRAIESPTSLAQLPAPGQQKTNGLASTTDFNSDAIKHYFDLLSKVLSDTTDTPISDIDAQTSIFSIGVDSIVAIRVAGACRKAQIPLNTMDIMRNANIGKLCEVALANSGRSTLNDGTKTLNDAATLVEPEIRREAISKLGRKESDIQDVLPLLAGQEYHLAMWLESGKSMFEPTWVFKAKNGLDTERLRATWKALVYRNESLRTCFVQVKPTIAMQVILDSESAYESKSFTTLLAPEDMDLEEFVKTEIRTLYKKPSTLYEPPARLYLIQGGGSRGDVLLLRQHHALYDAWSMGILIDELSSLYSGESQQKPAPLALSQFVQHTLNDLEQKKEEEFWRDTLSQCEPTIVAPQAVHDIASARRKRTFITFECSDVSKTALKSAARAYNVTVQCLILVAFGRMLSDVTDSNSPVFGYYTASRSAGLDGVDKLTSPTLNMLPIVIPKGLVTSPFNKADLTAQLQTFQAFTNSRSDYEQSRLRDVIHWASTKHAAPFFNAHLNILWNDEILLKSQASKETLLQPWSLGVPSDYAALEPLIQHSAVDGLDTSFLPTNMLFADIGPSLETSNLVIGIGCDPTLRDATGLGEIALLFSEHLSQIACGSA